MRLIRSLIPALLLTIPAVVYGYPNGTPLYLTDTGPFCASCHSAVKAEYMPELPQEAARKETPEGKHYAAIRAPLPSPYAELTNEQKEKLINSAKLIDSKSSVTVTGPRTAKPGTEITVTVKAKGGNGPVICVMLVDRPLRFQARPVASDGWVISKEPEVRGQDGDIQTSWLDKRGKGLKKNLNYINIENQRADLNAGVFPEGTVTYTLKAPSTPGDYTLTAAFLYGTENTDRAGFFQRPSGRILFSEELKIKVESPGK